MFNRKAFEAAIDKVAACYMKSAPTVETWCDFLATAKDDVITLADVHLLTQLSAAMNAGPTPSASSVANQVYHLNHRLGRDVTGQAGF